MGSPHHHGPDRWPAAGNEIFEPGGLARPSPASSGELRPVLPSSGERPGAPASRPFMVLLRKINGILPAASAQDEKLLDFLGFSLKINRNPMIPESFGPERGPLLEANLTKMSYNVTKVHKPCVFLRKEETFGRGMTKYSLESSVADEAKDARVGARSQASGTRTAHLSAKPGAEFGTYLRKVVPKMGYRC